MPRTVQIMLIAAFMCLLLCACDPDTIPEKVYCKMAGDGSGFVLNDTSLKVSTLGRAFYVDDDLVFYLGDKLFKSSLNSNLMIQLIPDILGISDKRYLPMDRNRNLLFFAANDAIYQVGFDGGNLIRLSPDDGGIYSAPALSSCGNYLTAIKDLQIARLDLQSGEWIELSSSQNAIYAVYFSDSNEYYCYNTDPTGYYTNISLCKIDAKDSTSTVLMEGTYGSFDVSWPNLRSSRDHRYFAMHQMREPQLIANYFSPDNWERYKFTLRVYDRLTGDIFTVSDCYSYAFVMGADELIYSRDVHGMADIMRRDLNNGNDTMVWDGYYYKNNYSYSVTEIFVRHDGQKIVIDAWKKALR